MIKAVLFDLDGTLLDTNELVYRSFNYIFNEKLNLNFDKNKIGENYGRPLEESFSKITENKEEIESLIKEYRKYNLEIHDDLCRPFIGTEILLNFLKDNGIKIGIVTSKKEDVAKRGLEISNLMKYIDIFVSPEHTKKHKPDGEPVIYALKKLGVKREDAIMVGDSPYDLLSGKNAGVKTCGVNYTMIDINELKKVNPDYFIDNPTDLIKIIEKEEF
ncbi:pyrophosphatase PpaX [Clostridium thermobutyricum]